MTKKERAQMIVKRLEQVYPEGICSLDYKSEPQCLGRLSAESCETQSEYRHERALQNIRP